ncbi:alkaline phosphatase D family protein [Solirubrobacter sp. CPCC 204708]|uniref:Alkaline phosphatase D family protein n=1 Tax=Solirubrobacter deserti TaxID=2282478 RepID=A0ABT4RT66_9ACTN|nr:alkaline phosphatase D family protein [Solirubrobacter deserti]MBE2315686.1 alkaline phosphatase D family protein [Solirubrobacter deserti]MDA0141736.1 alkaline phosphatase D family protein [Solirubrobacter deserti]
MRERGFDRRHFLKLAGGAAGAAALGQLPQWVAPGAASAALDPAPFSLGVASGDPSATGVMLWTRVDPGAMAFVPVRWEVSENEAFTKVVKRDTYYADPAWDLTVHAQVDGLKAGRWYWYRFNTGGQESVIGRTRTLPPANAANEPLRFAFASCQNWVGGAYPAYRDMAEQDLDFVLHLGDYIYETATGSLAEFRRLHALYKSSAELREAHRKFPFITTWDDHEVSNNYAGEVPGTANDARPHLERRANAYKAYYEYLPLRYQSLPRDEHLYLYKRFQWGRLAEFSVLDTRQYRSDQACGDGMRAPCDEVYDPARTMTGPEQEQWLLRGLKQSKARWNVIAQQTIMAPFDYDLGPGEVYNLDQWDGYPAARERILRTLEGERVSNPVILAGDWHSNWVNDVELDDRLVATEFAGTSISSGIGWDAAVREGLDANPHVKFYEGGYRGYVKCEVDRDRWETTLRIVTAPNNAASPAYTLAAFDVAAGTPGARRLDAGTGLAGKVTGTGGAPLRNVEIEVRNASGALVVERPTDADGEFSLFVAPGSYSVTANGVGYEVATKPATVTGASIAKLDFALTPVGLRAASGRLLPGARAEARATDLVLENAKLALGLSLTFEDGQLTPTTRGKPLDLAAVGHVDQLDWINLPYTSVAQPTGPEAWQMRTVRNTTVEVVSPGVVRATGTASNPTGISVVTTYTLEADRDFVRIASVFTNTTATALTFWLGDAMDHDGTGQRSGVAGHGTIATPYAEQAFYPPSKPWIGMTGTDGQTYGLVYAQAGFTAYGNGNWIQSQRQITLAPGASFELVRDLVAVSNGFGDPWAVLDSRV